jgi:hypothetical protein
MTKAEQLMCVSTNTEWAHACVCEFLKKTHSHHMLLGCLFTKLTRSSHESHTDRSHGGKGHFLWRLRTFAEAKPSLCRTMP